ncbi:MAG: carbohydrate ABC transporter permease [Caldilineaceae bacterium]|nr:carbohydrate ABC transporter permease [Caldilineaceae bacterium]
MVTGELSATRGQGNQTPRQRSSFRWLQQGGALFLVAFGSVIFLIPFLWMLSTSVKSTDLVYLFPPVWIPEQLRWENYGEAWQRLPFPTFYRNTLIIVVFNLIGTLFSSSLVAYSFARLRFRGRDLLFLVLLSTMMLPNQVTLIPTYFIFSQLGWINSLKPLIIPTYFGSAFNIFLLRQYFMTISPELDDAAKIDGCNFFGIYWRILLPLAGPALGVVAIFQFTYDWNDFFNPLIYVNSPKNFPIALGLRMLQGTLVNVPVQQVMAMTLVSILPMLLVFLLAQRAFIQGIVISGVKG